MSLFAEKLAQAEQCDPYIPSEDESVIPVRLCFRFFLCKTPAEIGPALRSLVYIPYDIKLTLRRPSPSSSAASIASSFRPTLISGPSNRESQIYGHISRTPTRASFLSNSSSGSSSLSGADAVLLDISEVLETQYGLPHPYSDPENWVFWGPTVLNKSTKVVTLGMKPRIKEWPHIPLYKCARPDGKFCLDAQISCRLGPPRFEEMVRWQFGEGEEGSRRDVRGFLMDIGMVLEYAELVDEEWRKFGRGSKNAYLMDWGINFNEMENTGEQEGDDERSDTGTIRGGRTSM